MNRFLIMIATICLMGASLSAEDYATLNDQGNKEYAKENYKGALDFYRRAEIERPETAEIYYNQANALLKNQSYEEAVEKYQKAIITEDASLQANAYYNGGSAYFIQEDYQNAIQWYENTLELNPEDMDAKYNLELARNKLREQMERKEQEGEGEGQDQQQQEQEQQEQDQGEQEQQQQQQQQQQQDENQEQQQQQQQQEKPKPDEMSEEDALRILKALEDSEKEDQKDIKRFKAQGTYRGKDW
jgi:Ca-activated chloride channel family protein